MSVINEIADERRRQITVEGFHRDHDSDHDSGQLSRAAMSYAQSASTLKADTSIFTAHPPTYWPWSPEWWKPKNPRRDLIRAAALIVAEIERLDRAEIGGTDPKPAEPAPAG